MVMRSGQRSENGGVLSKLLEGGQSYEAYLKSGGHSVQISDVITDNILTKYPITRPSGCPVDCTQ